MTKIEEIKNILNGDTIVDLGGHLNMNSIVKALSFNTSSDTELETFLDKQISKGNFSFDELRGAVKKAVKKANRTKHTFSTFDELNIFTANNECGDSWIDGENYSVYKY